MDFEQVKYEVADGAATITLNRPASHLGYERSIVGTQVLACFVPVPA